jgi:hypothetical protein
MGRFLSVGRLVNTKGITVTEATRIGENGGTLDQLLIRSPVCAKLSPRLERGEAGNPEPLEVVLLAPRHEGERLTSKISAPVHVYVGTVRGDDKELAVQIDPKDVVIRHWAILYPSREDAMRGRIA